MWYIILSVKVASQQFEPNSQSSYKDLRINVTLLRVEFAYAAYHLGHVRLYAWYITLTLCYFLLVAHAATPGIGKRKCQFLPTLGL